MKRLFFIAMIAAAFAWAACNNADDRYIDLNTGKKVKLEKDGSGLMVNAETKKPLYIYIDTKTNDTIYGKTGEVVNGHILKTGDNTYGYDMDIKSDGEYKYKDGDYKIKVEADGDIKIKDGDTKTKIDGETGEKKKKTD